MQIGGMSDLLVVLLTHQQRMLLDLLGSLTETQQDVVLQQMKTLKYQNEEIYEAMLKQRQKKKPRPAV